MKLLLLLLLLILPCGRLRAQTAEPSLWSMHLAYHDATAVVCHGSVLYALFNGNLLAYDTADGSVQLLDKTSGLSDKSISFMAWSETQRCLVLVYASNNIDLLYADGSVLNIPQVMNFTDATIVVKNLCVAGDWATLSTSQGVVLLNLARAEIKGYYQLGQAVTDAVVLDNEVFLSTSGGILQGKITDNLYDVSQWKQAFSITANRFLPAPDGGAYLLVPTKTGVNDNYAGVSYIGVPAPDGTRPLNRVTSMPMVAGAVQQNRIVFVGGGFVITVNPEKPLAEECRVKSGLASLSVGYTNDGTVWIVRTDKTLVNAKVDVAEKTFTETGVKVGGYGPRRDYCYKIDYVGNRLLVAGGRMDYSAGLQFEPTAMAYEDGEWTFFQESGFSLNDKALFRNVTSIAQDPADDTHHFVSCTSGLLEFRDFEFVKHYNASNSPIEVAPGGRNNPNYAIVDGLAYDSQGNLWMTNYEMDNVLKVLCHDGEWGSLNDPAFSAVSTPKQVCVDSDDRVWVGSLRTTGVHHSGVYALDFNGTPADGSDDEGVYRISAINEDGTMCSFETVYDIREDLNGQIWFGCGQGVFAVQNPADWFRATGFSIYQPKVPRNDGTNYADYLLTGVPVTAIAVDGGNRKWLGTLGSGIYLVSPDGSEVIEHFQTSNSPILSDNIYSLAVNPTTGELMIGTYLGLCSYRTGIVPAQPQLTKNNIKVYPNPVRPGYSGKVTVAGLTDGAEVKVVSTGSQLVARGQAVGGTFIWDVCSQATGRRVAPGVYYIYVANVDGSDSIALKLVVI